MFIDKITPIRKGKEMQDSQELLQFMYQYFDEIPPSKFYRTIFPAGELEKEGEQQQGKYNAIAVELLPQEDNKQHAKRYILGDSLEQLEHLLQSENFIILSPISYAGRSREAKNARFIYAMAIDLDGVATVQHITDLFYQVQNGIIPKPTFVVWSGTGLHLYYQFTQPIPCFKNITKQMAALKQALTKKIWNKYITIYYEKPQLQSLFQGFRIAGGITKGGSRTRAFITGEPIDIEYLNEFVDDKSKVKDFKYKSKLTLKEAAAKYPEWYDKRVIQQQPKGTWQCKKDLYNWWLKRLKQEITTGHRYYGIMILAIYAKKCGVDRETLEADAFSLLERMEELTTDEKNHFKREDILAALEMYNDNYIRFPIDSITALTALPIEKNKRNGRKQAEHIKLMNFVRDQLNGNTDWRYKDGAPTKEAIIRQWQLDNPAGTKAQCIRDTGISKPTVYKWWKE